MITVLKLGGELLEDTAAIQAAAAGIVRLAHEGPLVVVHGGGRAIDAELRARGLSPRFADGLRITDVPTLDVVVAVLAGRNNTALVAAVGAAGGKAIGLTGADGAIGLCRRAPLLETSTGDLADLGLVGEPVASEAELLEDLLALGCIPIVASIGVGPDGELFNVNADVLAASLAAAIGAGRLIVAGTTAGVLDAGGTTIPVLHVDEIESMAASRVAHSGMIAKLTACAQAIARGVREVSIVSGRGATDFGRAEGTRIAAGGLRESVEVRA